MPDFDTKEPKKHRAKDKPQVLRERVFELRRERCRRISPEDVDHSGVDDIHAVEEHVDDDTGDEGSVL